MSDAEGKILLTTGGCFILNKQFKLMDNGDSINSFFTYRSWCKGYDDGDFPVEQNNTILPYPDSPHLKIVLNLDFDYAPNRSFVPIPYHLFYHVVDIRQNGALGKVTQWKKIALSDTLGRGQIQAIRHKNGISWWLLTPRWNSNCYFITEVTPFGVQIARKQCLGSTWYTNHTNDTGGLAASSSNGTKYARINSYNNFLVLFNFNNSDGELSNPIELTFPETDNYPRGVCFSPNTRYLYVAAKFHLYQYDLNASNIQASIQLVGDLSNLVLNSEKGLLRFPKLAPDGKIYISSPFSHKFLSVINRPNCPGKLCDFKAHSLELPAYNYNGLPNNPFFEIPPANYSCDSLATTAEIIEPITLYPNPATNQISISSTEAFQTFEIIDITGKIVLKGKMNDKNDIAVSGLPDGLYFLTLKNTSTQARAIGKFVVKH